MGKSHYLHTTSRTCIAASIDNRYCGEKYKYMKCQSLVPLLVPCKMVGPCKGMLTMRALEWLHTVVLAHVAGKLIRASKLPAATLPVALVGFFSRVCSLVGLEMRALSVDLVASGIRAAVHTLVPLRRLGIVVHGIHELIGGVCREAVSKELRVEWLLDVDHGGVLGEGRGGKTRSIDHVSRSG